ncbi:carbohydrate ABC transporter permease [Dictyobacter formicarum]|uniref:Sugar ABC transporter permease n=1 Tax=Dictyobacter formicarum TaxID=2778368 RepID=A0ABQ3VBW6_9CHLR|nr:sugar ABC transporter permease [Dictyobacter formicarum]GHO83284.1 sugar ABC transporter permease [Dictyobacter formicarum]
MSQIDQTFQVPPLPQVQRNKVPADERRRRGGRWFHFPALIYMIVLTQIPFLLVVWFSLHAWNLLVPSEGFPLVGLSNYSTEFFHDPNFWPIMGNTLELVAGAIILALITGTIFALLLNRPLWGRSVLRAVATIPFLATPSVMVLIWKNLFLSSSSGLVNWGFQLVGLPAVSWFSTIPLQSIIFIVAWEWTPFVMLVILAGLQAIPGEILEAARVDGASVFTLFWRVVFPLLRKAYEIALLFGTIFIFQTFAEIYVTTAGGPGLATNTLPYYTYRTALSSFQIGQAATLGVIGVIVAIFAARGMLQLITERS